MTRSALASITDRGFGSEKMYGGKPACASKPAANEVKVPRLHEVLEKEARRMAQSLHDGAGQLLAAVHLKLDEVTWNFPAEERRPVQELKSMLDNLESELRRLSHELRPLVLDDLGLFPALQLLTEGMSHRTGLVIHVDGSIAERLNPIIETALYRIIQEALRSAHHAYATNVVIALLKEETRIRCSVRQSGRIEVESDFALLAIRQRVEDLSGAVSICISSNGTAELVVSIPLA